MCQHVKVRYQCGHVRYCVLCWCDKYADSHKCCPLAVHRYEHLITERCGCCKETNSLFLRLKQYYPGIHRSSHRGISKRYGPAMRKPPPLFNSTKAASSPTLSEVSA